MTTPSSAKICLPRSPQPVMRWLARRPMPRRRSAAYAARDPGSRHGPDHIPPATIRGRTWRLGAAPCVSTGRTATWCPHPLPRHGAASAFSTPPLPPPCAFVYGLPRGAVHLMRCALRERVCNPPADCGFSGSRRRCMVSRQDFPTDAAGARIDHRVPALGASSSRAQCLIANFAPQTSFASALST